MFNIDDYDPEKERSFDLLPAGVYEVLVNKAELKFGVNGDRKWWNFTFEPNVEVTHPYSGRYIFGSCTFEDRSRPEWEKRGRSQLADVCFAAGLPKSFDIDDLPNLLEGKQLVLRTYHKKDKETGEKKVQVGGYYTLEGKSRAGERCAEKKDWITSHDPVAKVEHQFIKTMRAGASASPPTAKPTQSGSKAFDEDVPF